MLILIEFKIFNEANYQKLINLIDDESLNELHDDMKAQEHN